LPEAHITLTSAGSMAAEESHEHPHDLERFPPPEEISLNSHCRSFGQYKEMYQRSVEEPDAFWREISDTFKWNKPWETLTRHNFDLKKGNVSIKWFEEGETNVCYNCLDRHVEAGHGDQIAFLWEGNDGEEQSCTYAQMLDKVCRMANVLLSCGVKKGDPVAIYLPMIIDLPVTMLACARIGAVHSVIFGGFSAESLAGRILDSKCKVIVTADGVMRGAKPITLKQITDDAVKLCMREEHALVDHVLVVQRLGEDKVPIKAQLKPRDKMLEELLQAASPECPITWCNAEDPLFMLYTSGSTGKPKGVLHTTAGYMIWSSTTFKYTFDYRPGDIFFCTADCGWITGHSYITYGPMLNRATQVLFEGVPTYPDVDRFWRICEKYKVTQFYTAPTAIRALMAYGDEPVRRCKLDCLRILGSVGEPINAEAWKWYHKVVGGDRCPIVDTWWQTETGGHMITPLPGATTTKPGSATFPFFGVVPVVLDSEGQEITDTECSGYLAVKQSWPGQMRTIFNDHPRFEQTYFTLFNAENRLISDRFYITGDGCRRDKDGYYWLTGRVDDVINVSGHRIGTAEVESSLDEHLACSEAAVVGYPHPIKGEGIYAFVTLTQAEGITIVEDEVRKELKNQVRHDIGAFAAPDIIHFVSGLPKTRSGKIMRRILRKIASGHSDDLGDITTLADPSVVAKIIETKASAK